MTKRFMAYVVLYCVLLIFSAGCRRIPLYDRSTSVNIVIDLDRELDHEIVMTVDKPLEKIYTDGDRDFWMTSQEALEYGMIDEILTKRK